MLVSFLLVAIVQHIGQPCVVLIVLYKNILLSLMHHFFKKLKQTVEYFSINMSLRWFVNSIYSYLNSIPQFHRQGLSLVLD